MNYACAKKNLTLKLSQFMRKTLAYSKKFKELLSCGTARLNSPNKYRHLNARILP